MKTKFKKSIRATLVVMLLLSLLPVTAYAADIVFSGGSGTSDDPWQITTAAQLASLATEVNAGNEDYAAACYKLMNNLDLSGYNSWTPIGISDSNYFGGTFDGNGKIISGLKISGTTYTRVGLFGQINGACIKNLGVNVGSVSNTNTSTSYTGGLIGYSLNGTVTNCYAVGGNISANSAQNAKYSGGLIGYCSGGLVQYCYVTVNVSATNATALASSVYAGGLIGACGNTVMVTNCYATGSVSTGTGTGTADSTTGGLIGTSSSNVAITNCYATGNTSASTTGTGALRVGGLVGNNNGAITNGYWNNSASQTVNGSGQTKKGVGTGASTGTTGMTAANMQAPAFVTQLNDSNTDPAVSWYASSSFNNSYPRLVKPNTATVTTETSKLYDKTPMPITVTADYGTAVLEYFADNGGEKGASLGSAERVNAGTYWVTATVAEGMDYEATVSEVVQFTITPRAATFAWTQNHYFYTGSAHVVSARVANLLSGDTCAVTLKNNVYTKIGEYTAEVVSLGNPNYTPGETAEYHWSITDPDVSFNMGAERHGYHVQGLIKKPQPSLYKVDIAWGAMKFDYSTGNAWNPDIHEYAGDTIVGWQPESFSLGNNKITTYNHSNRDVIVSLDVTKNSLQPVGVNMRVNKTNSYSGAAAQDITLKRVQSITAPATRVNAYVWLNGTPSNLDGLGETYKKVGVITVTVEATESDLTPQEPVEPSLWMMTFNEP